MKKYLFIIISITLLLFNCKTPYEPEDFSTNWPLDADYVFVDVDYGTDGAAGTRVEPVDDINEGISIANTDNKDVCVAQGTYYITNQINIVEGVSLYGGYAGNGDWSKDIENNETTISSILTVAITRVVMCPTGVTSLTVLDGFTLRGGPASSNSYAIECNGALTISNNKIYAFLGVTPHLNSIGIKIANAHPQIINNYIHGGDYQFSYGIKIAASSGLISGNTIYGGNGEYSYAIYCYPGSPTVQDNTLDGGAGSTTSCCIYTRTNSSASAPYIDNNKFNTVDGGGDYGLYETDDSDNPVNFTDNEFVSVFSQALYKDQTGGVSRSMTTIGDVNDLDDNGYNPAGTVHGNY